MNVLVVDIGGTHVKISRYWTKTISGISIGTQVNPKQMVAGVKNLAKDWWYDAIIQSFSHPRKPFEI
jgi:polyphosphate glucokinase